MSASNFPPGVTGCEPEICGYDDAIRYGPWRIWYEPPPIPTRMWDWQFVHDAYDGPGDNRHGSAASVEDALAQIRDIEEMNAEDDQGQGSHYR